MIVDTFGGHVHVEWNADAALTPLGQLPFFAEYLKISGLFDAWVGQCPLSWTSPNAPLKHDVLGTAVLSALCGHQRYAHSSALRGDSINAPLLGMSKVVSEDSVRRALKRLDETAGVTWLQRHLLSVSEPL
ncbi:MAG: transposase, partial [Gammaproteobacteria bacterium]|nr:transposase [Gammaproteobacteria bacterium]